MIMSIAHMPLTMSFVLLLAPGQTANPEDEKAIRESAAKYAEAYSRGDVDTLVAQYAKDAIYDEGEGPVIAGSDEIRNALKAGLADSPGTKMAIEIKSIRFIKGRAIEIGVATLTPAKGEPEQVPYRAIHAKQPDGKWLLKSVGPDITAEGSTSAGPLDDLVWLLGAWKDSEAEVDLSSTCRWDPNRRFLIRTFVMKDEGRSTLEITEIIGWDAADRIVRSWVFDSDGGVGQNTWSKRGAEWIISAKGTLPDGGRASAVNIIHPLDDNSFTWSSTNRDVDGEMLPDIDDVKFVRDTVAQASAGGSK
jgi:uncharacterized protein (TIGR02246 family)